MRAVGRLALDGLALDRTGVDRLALLRRVHWPLLKRSVAAAGLLVFVDVMKELPATMLLRPFNTDTLAVVAYQLARDERLRIGALAVTSSGPNRARALTAPKAATALAAPAARAHSRSGSRGVRAPLP